jgi:hypothetical protein
MLDSVSFQFASSYGRFCILVASRCASSHLFDGFLLTCTIDRIDRSLYFQFASFYGLVDLRNYFGAANREGHLDSSTIVSVCTLHVIDLVSFQFASFDGSIGSVRTTMSFLIVYVGSKPLGFVALGGCFNLLYSYNWVQGIHVL